MHLPAGNHREVAEPHRASAGQQVELHKVIVDSADHQAEPHKVIADQEKEGKHLHHNPLLAPAPEHRMDMPEL